MRAILIIPMVLAGWLGLALLAMLPGGIATAAIPKTGIELPVGVAIVGATSHLLIVKSDDPDYVRKLYDAGAPFVLPARQKTCLDLQS